jgi:RNA polymerase sigma-70 factor (ECF subfamily)
MMPVTEPAHVAIRPQQNVPARLPAAVPLAAADEQYLIEAAHRGDRAAFQTIVERHQGGVYGYLRSRLLEAADAEDLTQEVFLRSYVGHARFESTVLIRPWLLGIARNVLREHVRKIKRRKEVAWTELCLRLEDELVEFETHAYEDVMAHLPECLGSLGQSARQAIDMRYQARLRLSEIGEKLHRSEGAVKLLMFRARQALRRCLDAKLPSPGS